MLRHRDHRRQPLRLLPPDRARRRDRPRRRDAAAARRGGRRPLRPAVRAAEVRQDEPAPARAPGRGAPGGDDPDPRRPLRRALGGRRRDQVRARVRAAAEGEDACADRGVPAGHRARPLARRVRDQREAAAEPPVRPPSGAAHAARSAAPPRGERWVPRPDRARRVPGHHEGQADGRRPAQPHPVPGRGGVVRVRRVGAGTDARAVREQGAPALRPGRADAPGQARRCRHRQVRRPALHASRDAASARP